MHFRSLKKSSNDVYFEEPVESDKDGNSLSLMDLISDGEDLGDTIELRLRTQQLYRRLEEILSDREKRVMTLRYGLYSTRPMTQRETAALLDISRSYVSRIEKRALEKLRDAMEK